MMRGKSIPGEEGGRNMQRGRCQASQQTPGLALGMIQTPGVLLRNTAAAAAAGVAGRENLHQGQATHG